METAVCRASASLNLGCQLQQEANEDEAKKELRKVQRELRTLTSAHEDLQSMHEITKQALERLRFACQHSRAAFANRAFAGIGGVTGGQTPPRHHEHARLKLLLCG